MALFTLVLAVMLPTGAFAEPTQPAGPALDDQGKIWVCKYTRTPGGDEVLKPGNDGLVVVSPSTLTNVDSVEITNIQVGDEWTDRQERSEVIAPGGTCPGAVATTLIKDWQSVGGDEIFDEDAVDVTFTVTYDTQEVGVDDGDSFDVGPGTEVTVTETVTGLPDECEFVAVGFEDGAFTHTVGDEDETVEITNHVTCDDDVGNGALPDVSVTLVKNWQVVTDEDERFDEDDVDVTFTVDDDTTVEDGETFDVAPGTEVTVTETVTGLPDECEFDAVGFEDGAFTHTVGDEDETVEITNQVSCEGAEAVAGVRKGQPQPVTVDADSEGAEREVDENDVEVLGVMREAVDEDDVEVLGTLEAEDDDGVEVLGVTFEADDEDDVEVLGVTRERAAGGELPRTGATTTEMLTAALMALLFGTALLLATRRESAAAAGPVPANGSTGATAGVWTAAHRGRGGTSHRVAPRTTRGGGVGPPAPG